MGHGLDLRYINDFYAWTALHTAQYDELHIDILGPAESRLAKNLPLAESLGVSYSGL